MQEQKKKVGAPKKKNDEKKVKLSHFFDREVADKLETLPDGTRSKFVTHATALYFKILDGSVSIVTDETNTNGEQKEILRDTGTM